jgi:hypothetical protein
VVVEVKLRTNPEARRAVVAQVLAYAAALHGASVEEFERDILARHLGGRDFFDVVREAAQAEIADEEDFRATLHAALQTGGFRLVLVLDQVPQELVKLAGFLEAVSQDLIVDLVTVWSYGIAGQRYRRSSAGGAGPTAAHRAADCGHGRSHATASWGVRRGLGRLTGESTLRGTQPPADFGKIVGMGQANLATGTGRDRHLLRQTG